MRAGNRWDISAPRNTYRTRDGKWLAMSGSSPALALRVFRAIGRSDLVTDADFSDPQRRLGKAGEVDAVIADWVAGQTLAQAMAIFSMGVTMGPMPEMVVLLDPPRAFGRQPLFQTALVLQNAALARVELEGLEASALAVGTRTTKFDLSFEFREGHDQGAAAGGLRRKFAVPVGSGSRSQRNRAITDEMMNLRAFAERPADADILRDSIAFAAALLGIEPPPEEPFDGAVMSEMARSFYEDNRRVRIDKLKRELGFRPRYPTYRDGLRALAAAGEGQG